MSFRADYPRRLWLSLILTGSLGLSACAQLSQEKETVADLSAKAATSPVQPAAASDVEVETTAKPVAKPDPTAETIARLLEAAEQAVRDNRLTTPLHDNAFDRYQAVLLLSPNNTQALSGLDQVMMRYLDLARDAVRSYQFRLAEELTDKAAEVGGNRSAVGELRDEIRQARRAYQATINKPPVEPVVNGNEIIFDGRALARKDDRVVDQLQDLALQIQKTDESMLIVARSDAEGRWIYQRMREAVPGYRLRGDIRLGRIPKIELLPPID